MKAIRCLYAVTAVILSVALQFHPQPHGGIVVGGGTFSSEFPLVYFLSVAQTSAMERLKYILRELKLLNAAKSVVFTDVATNHRLNSQHDVFFWVLTDSEALLNVFLLL